MERYKLNGLRFYLKGILICCIAPAIYLLPLNGDMIIILAHFMLFIGVAIQVYGITMLDNYLSEFSNAKKFVCALGVLIFTIFIIVFFVHAFIIRESNVTHIFESMIINISSVILNFAVVICVFWGCWKITKNEKNERQITKCQKNFKAYIVSFVMFAVFLPASMLTVEYDAGAIFIWGAILAFITFIICNIIMLINTNRIYKLFDGKEVIDISNMVK